MPPAPPPPLPDLSTTAGSSQLGLCFNVCLERTGDLSDGIPRVRGGALRRAHGGGGPPALPCPGGHFRVRPLLLPATPYPNGYFGGSRALWLRPCHRGTSAV